ncbi:MAG: DeoR/GlpR family DNA-binding transcription regulator [Henriciella sp.]
MSEADLSNLAGRQKEILELIRSHGYVATEQLVRQFGVTAQTIRRDINLLCELELIERFHGGAGRIGNAYNQPYQDRVHEGMEAKRKIARLVASRIPQGASLFLNIGTTTEALAAELVGRTDLRIVTNNINIANMMRETDGSDVMIAGGFVRQSDGGIVGEATTEFLKQFRLDIGVIGISGIDEDGSLLDFDYQEIRSAQAIIQNSRTVYLVADSAKFGRRAMVRLGQYDDIDHLFTDQMPPEAFMDAIRQSDMELHVADEL